MFAILAYIRPLDLKTNTRVDVRIASTPGPSFQGLGGLVWESAITRRPRASMELFALDLSPGTRTPTADMEFSLSGIKEVDVSSLHWLGAPITIYRADTLQWPAPVEFDGIIVEPRRDLATDKMTITCQVPTKALEVDLLTKTFNDTTLTFDPDKRTVLLPAGYGHCYNVEPVPYDTISNIFMLDGYGNLLGVDWLGEGLSSLGPSVADYPNAAALRTALNVGAVPPGRWATSIADGVLGTGAPPTGVITGHARFGYGMTGALMRRALLTHAGISADRIESASFDAIDAALPYPIHYWTADQRQVKDLLEALAAGCNASPIVTLQNRIAVVRPFHGARVGTFVRNGFSEPAVTDWKTNDAVTPYWKIAARVARPGRVMTLEEVNYVDALIDRGIYDNTAVYRQGNVVWLRNKSQWLYDNVTASAGHAPPDPAVSDAWWQQLAPAPTATDIRYGDGTPIEVLQPAEPDAQITRTMVLDLPTVTFVFDDSGIVAGQLPFSIRATVTAANYDVTGTSDFSITPSAGITATIDNDFSSPTRGKVTITGMADKGTIQVHATSGGVYLSQTITLARKGVLGDATTIGTNDLRSSSVSQTEFVILGSTVSCDYNAPTTVMTFNFQKHEDNSFLEVIIFGQFNSGDDLQFDATIIADTAVFPAGTFNVTLDSLHSQGKAPMSPFALITGLAKGIHTISFSVFNREPDDGPLMVQTGSVMKITEYKTAAI